MEYEKKNIGDLINGYEGKVEVIGKPVGFCYEERLFQGYLFCEDNVSKIPFKGRYSPVDLDHVRDFLTAKELGSTMKIQGDYNNGQLYVEKIVDF